MLTNKNMSFFDKNTNKIDFAILSAMPEELQTFKDILYDEKHVRVVINGFKFDIFSYNNKRILLACTGLGTAFAASVMTLIHANFKPAYIFFSGTAGGIKSDLNICDVVVIEKAFEAEIQDLFKMVKNTPFESCLTHPLKNQQFPSTHVADKNMLDIALNTIGNEKKIRRGTAVTSNVFPAPQELFEKIKSANADCIDMESSAIYQIAWLLNVPALVVRGISNILNHDGTDDKIHQSNVKGSAQAAAMFIMKILDNLLKNTNLNEPIKNIDPETEIEKLINFFNLQPHPEGGYYAQTFKSTTSVNSTNSNQYDNETRSAGTAIYYLLAGNDFSTWHRLKSDEMWHHYQGCSTKIYVITEQGNLITYLLGNPLNHDGAAFQVLIKMGSWFAAEPVDKNSYCLVGCTVTPGFEFKDFELGHYEKLSSEFPQHSATIKKLARAEHALNQEGSESINIFAAKY